MSSIITAVLSEAIIEFNNSIGKQSISFLANLISECSDTSELKEQFEKFFEKNSITKDEDKTKIYNSFVNNIQNNNEIKNQLPNNHPLLNSTTIKDDKTNI